MAPIVVGVAGGSASGKTTVVRRLVEHLGPSLASVLEHDRYYRDHSHLPPEHRVTVNYDHPDALETDLLVAHVRQLRDGLPAAVPVYDFARHARAPRVDMVPPRRTIIVEGILVFTHAALRGLMDIKVFVDTPPAARLERRLRRDVAERGRSPASVLAQYSATVLPMHDTFVEPTRAYADLVIEGGGFSDAAIAAVAARILARLG